MELAGRKNERGHASGQTEAWRREIELDGIMAEQMNSVREQTRAPKHSQPPALDTYNCGDWLAHLTSSTLGVQVDFFLFFLFDFILTLIPVVASSRCSNLKKNKNKNSKSKP